MREARREIDSVVDSLKAATGALAADADRRAARLVPTGAMGAARSEARAAVDAIGERLPSRRPRQCPRLRRASLRTGRRQWATVCWSGLGMEGIVKSMHDRDAEVDVRGKRLRARVEELRVVGGAMPGRTRRGSA